MTWSRWIAVVELPEHYEFEAAPEHERGGEPSTRAARKLR